MCVCVCVCVGQVTYDDDWGKQTDRRNAQDLVGLCQSRYGEFSTVSKEAQDKDH